MASSVIGNSVLTLADWAKRLDPNGSIASIIELLTQQNEILQDMSYMEGNLPVGHQATIRTGLPTAYWRSINQSIPSSKSTTAQVLEQCGMLEAYSDVDVDELALNGNEAEYRASEGMAFLEAMYQELASTIIYGNRGASPNEFTGFATRYSSLSAGNGGNIIDMLGTGSDNTSAYLVGWSPRTVTGIFPKGSVAGLQHRDLGQRVADDGTGPGGSRLLVKTDHYQVKAGLVVPDWRYVVRMANIDVSDLGSNATAADILRGFIKATYKMPKSGAGTKLALYVNSTILQAIDLQSLDAMQYNLTWETVAGKRMGSLGGIPIRRMDAILNNEARVV